MNKAIEQIDVNTELSKEDFLTLFIGQLPLKEEEIQKVADVYYPTYTTFVSSGVEPRDSWVAIRNLFISQETQIGERIKNGSS
ncbi:MAG TPA: hypothetical protein PK122_01485 [Candidatus Paceibacterota bacterium]|nr:hypothetical protein [Candidatus Paceibacterota bacterium]